MTSAVIRGSTVYTNTRLFTAYSGQLGLPLTRTTTDSVISALQRMYANDGYSQPELRVDARTLSVGILHIDILEPRFTQVAVDGNCGPYRRRLETLSAAIIRSNPVRPEVIQHALQEMRSLPGLSITAATRRDDQLANGFVLALRTSYDPVSGEISAGNRGSREIGPDTLQARFALNNQFESDDRLGVILTAASDFDEYHGGGVFLEIPTAADGTRLLALAFASSSNPHESPADLDDLYTRHRALLRLTHPVWSHDAWNLALSGALEIDNLRIDGDGVTLQDYRLRIFAAGMQLGWQGWPASQYLASLDVRHGLNTLGADLRSSAPELDPTRGDFLVTKLQLTSVTPLGGRWSARIDALAQRSTDVLPYTEDFLIGGEVLGRGFEVTEVAGDQGAGAKFEVRRELGGDSPTFGRRSLYGFYDFGAAWSNRGAPPQSAATAGGGVALTGGSYAGYLELSKPLTHPDIDGRRSFSLFAELSRRF